MEEPRSLDSLFKEKIFRIPDYQRGYAWQREQLKDFWEDLINLSEDRSHYTGVLTLKEILAKDISENHKEYWLVEDHSYKLYHIVDGQQRLTTFIIFLQAFVESIKSLDEFQDKASEDIYITDSLNLSNINDKYLYKVKPTGDQYRTYKFGYTEDNPSYEYLRYKILNESGKPSLQETFYTLNLNNAKVYFKEQFTQLYEEEGIEGLQEIYKKLTKKFLFNEYIIKDEFDVFVAFETMNNRGKKLSDLELLKNRLIYLSTLYDDNELDPAERTNLRNTINEAWKEVYYQLGRNRNKPLNDDDFLRAHWIIYFMYSRQTGKDYIKYLLDDKFSPQKVHKKVEREVALEDAEEQVETLEYDDENDNGNDVEETQTVVSALLEPKEINDYVLSLKESAVHWFNSFYPDFSKQLSDDEVIWLDRLNRIGIGYFRPLVMSILKNVENVTERIEIFKKIERFIFIAFRMNSTRANYGSSEFYSYARSLDKGQIELEQIDFLINDRLAVFKNSDGTFSNQEFFNVIDKKFKRHLGYYGWPGLRYFLYEYELSLLNKSRQKKVDWDDLLKTPKDKFSIEHIYPQTESQSWSDAFSEVEYGNRKYYGGSLGNLLLLSSAINSSLQNDSFEDKKKAKYGYNEAKIRNGYEDGSHSEIEVSKHETWGPDEIYNRGLKLLKFMEERWDFSFKNDEERQELLFLDFDDDEEQDDNENDEE